MNAPTLHLGGDGDGDTTEIIARPDSGGGEAIEVIAQFDGSILDVQHLLPPPADAHTQALRTRALLAGGGVALAMVPIAFAISATHVILPRAIDPIVALLMVAGTWLLMRGLARAAEPATHEFTVGDDARATCAIAPGALPLARFPLVRAGERGWEMIVVPSMRGELGVGGVMISLAEACARGLALPSPIAGGARSIALGSGARAWLAVGNASFTIAAVAPPARHAAPVGFDWGRELYTGGVALAVSAFVFLLFSLPPEAKSLALDQIHTQQIAHFLLTAPEPPPPPPAPDVKSPSSGGHGSAAASGESGKIGRPTATARHGALRIAGHEKEAVRRLAEGAARNSGILPMLEGAQLGQVFHDGPVLGADPATILGDMQNPNGGDAYGHNGLDPAGVNDGPGGGGRSGPTIGVGPLHSIGDCATCGDGRTRYGSQPPSARLIHKAKEPEFVPGRAEVRCGVNGACLDREIVRRIVHQHHNEVRFCYVKQLMMRPELSGRVVTQFTIGSNGAVLSSLVTESSLHDGEIEQCIAQAVRRWEFPPSQQTSMVTYPFMLQAAH